MTKHFCDVCGSEIADLAKDSHKLVVSHFKLPIMWDAHDLNWLLCNLCAANIIAVLKKQAARFAGRDE